MRKIEWMTTKDLHGGRVMIQQFQDINHVPLMTLGMMFPGEYPFPDADQDETVTVRYGVMIINGVRYAQGEACKIKKGEKIVVSTDGFAAWETLFGDFGPENGM